LQRSSTPGLEGNDTAHGFGLRSPNNTGWRGGFAVKEIEANFNPALGYVNRAGVRDLTVDAGYTRYLDSDFWQRLIVGIDAQRVSLLDGGGLDSEAVRVRVFELETNTSDNVEYSYTARKEIVDEAFTLYEDFAREVGVAPGRYSYGEHELKFAAGQHRPFSGELGLQWGDFFAGTRQGIVGSFAWRQSPNFRVSLDYAWNDIELPDGQFISRLIGVTTELAFSSRWFWINLIQYDNISEAMGINSRLQWIPKAGQEGFIVLNHNLQDFDKDNSFDSASADLSLKFTYTFRF